MVRLLQSGLIKLADLKRKFVTELHANEIVLLAYYIAAINIEETFHSLIQDEYEPFRGIVLTDTFQTTEVTESGDSKSALSENDKRLTKQKKSGINVIVGNPPYSVGQGDGNDNNQNLKYPMLDARIRDTYASESSATLKNSLYDSYIRAIRWATDRIGDSGVIGFVTNAGFLDSNTADGLRKVLQKEFAKMYCLNLRGNQRTSGELSKREGGKIFGSGSRTPVAITIFVKDPAHKGDCEIFYHDIGDYLSRDEKLAKVEAYSSIDGIMDWQTILPNTDGDWISHRSEDFEKFLQLGSKDDDSGLSLFTKYSGGVKTNRDPWVYNFSEQSVAANMKSMINVFNLELRRYQEKFGTNSDDGRADVEGFVDSDPKKIKWTRELFADVVKGKAGAFAKSEIVYSLYRPFTKQFLYFNRRFNNTVYQMPRLFPTAKHSNIVITVTGIGINKDFSSLVSKVIPDVQLLANGQCFPLYYYEHTDDLDEDARKAASGDLDKDGFIRRCAISPEGLKRFQSAYLDSKITAEDLFYYVYGVLHSPVYRERFQNDLKKMLPRMPFLTDFWGYSKAGRELAHWHLSYESIKPFKLVEEVAGKEKDKRTLCRVTEMKHPKSGKIPDKSVIIYNQHVTIKGIPLEAYDYIVNGKPALDWIMERYAIKVDKDSGIKNDPNDWSEDPRYIIDLIGRVVTVSLETNRIVRNLPKFEILVVKAK